MRRPTASSFPLARASAAAVLFVSFALSALPLSARADEFFRGDGTTYTLGKVSAGNCNMMAANTDASDNYAALNDVQWNGLKNCGRCAQVSCDDNRCADKSASQVVQILDRCPECKHGDLDLSPSVFRKLTGSNPSRYKIKWKFVDCPVQGSIKFCLKAGSNNFWTAIQPTNVVSGVSNLKVNGQATTMVDSAYYYLLNGNSQTQTDLSAIKVTLTSVNGETVTDTVSLTAGACTSGKVQFSSKSRSGGDEKPSTAPSTQPVPTIKPAPTLIATTSPMPSLTAAPPSESTASPAATSSPQVTIQQPSSSPTSAPPAAPIAAAPSEFLSTVPLTLDLVVSPAITAETSTAPSTTTPLAIVHAAASTPPPPQLPASMSPHPSVRRCRAKARGGDSDTHST